MRSGPMVALWFSVLAILAAGPLPADPWAAATGLGSRQFDQGRYREAVAHYERALAVSDSPAHRGDTLYRLAVAHGKLAEYSMAEECYREALGIFRAEGDSSRLALTLAGLGEVYRNEYRPARALLLENQNLAALEHIGRGRSTEAATILNITGAILFEERKFKEAERAMRDALDIVSGISGPESLDASLILNHLGAVALARGRLSEAETLVARSLEIRRARFGPEHPLIAGAMLSLASVYSEQRRYAEAERTCRDSIDMMSRFLPVNHPDLMKAHTQLAAIVYDAGKTAAAISILEDVAARVGKNRSAISLEYVQLLNLYSRYLEALGQKEKSRLIHAESEEFRAELNRPSQGSATVAVGELTAGELPR